MTDNDIIKFGAHKGTRLGDLDPRYLEWLYYNYKCSADMRSYIEKRLKLPPNHFIKK